MNTNTNNNQNTAHDLQRLVEALPPLTADEFFATAGRKFDLSHEWTTYRGNDA